MKYFIDTEFHEYKKKPFIGSAVDTIDLISIGISCEDGRSYYAVCKDFDVKSAWSNSWLRQNVLHSVWCDLKKLHDKSHPIIYAESFSLFSLKFLLKKVGRSKDQIAKEVKVFIKNYRFDDTWEEGDRYESSFGNGYNNTYYYVKGMSIGPEIVGTSKSTDPPEFYAYYADYDWVVFCWMFGRMIDLPKGYPMYCKDLKQMLDEKVSKMSNKDVGLLCEDAVLSHPLQENIKALSLDFKLDKIKKSYSYPKQENEHNALDDAKWNKSLFEFITKSLP